MTFPDGCVEEEFWSDPDLGELTVELKRLGDLSADLHTFLHGPGGDWNGKPDLYCCGF